MDIKFFEVSNDLIFDNLIREEISDEEKDYLISCLEENYKQIFLLKHTTPLLGGM